MTTPAFQMHTPTAVEFGVGAAAHLGQRAARLGMRHALLVTDAGLAESLACVAARQSLSEAGVAATLYADVMLDPDEGSVERAAAAYRQSGADGLVALGGGSAMDTAKALGVLAVGGGERIAPYFFGGPARVRGIPPLICMPTTAGTGSEVTYVAVVTAGTQKMIVRDQLLAPALALIDPALTLSMPPRLTAATGMDALSHALEAFTSTLANPLCDVLALDAIRRIARALPRAVDSGDDLAARAEMSLAALGAGVAFVNARVHLGHAVGHSLGGTYKLPHGLACIVCMPALLEFLRPTCGLQLAQIADALGVVGGDDEQASDLAAPAVAALMRRCGVPGLAELAGVGRTDLPRMVELVLAEERLLGLSRAKPSSEEWAAIFEASF